MRTQQNQLTCSRRSHLMQTDINLVCQSVTTKYTHIQTTVSKATLAAFITCLSLSSFIYYYYAASHRSVVDSLYNKLYNKSTINPRQIHDKSTTNPRQIHDKSTTNPRQIHDKSTTNQKLYNESTRSPQLHSKSGVYNNSTTSGHVEMLYNKSKAASK